MTLNTSLCEANLIFLTLKKGKFMIRMISKGNIALAGTLILMLSLISSTVQAKPNDPFTGASPSLDTRPPEPTTYNLGEWGVSEQRGAAIYTYPISVPQGRNGMSPSLALRYSSQSPTRGGIAVGWTLDIPSITIDNSLGHEGKEFYRVSLPSVSGRLVEVPDELPFSGTAYRVEFDESFTRLFHRFYEIDQSDNGWIALTPDGIKHFFEVRRPSSDGKTIWNITSQVDSFGNTIRYFWSEVAAPNGQQIIDRSLDLIEYTFNEEVGLGAHAKVELEYAPLEVCAGNNVPTGAAVLSTPPGAVRGARRLTAIKTFVRKNPGQTAWRLDKNVSLEYQQRSSTLHLPLSSGDPIPPNLCTQNHMRYLTQITIAAHDVEGQISTLPPITFKYNSRIDTTRPILFGASSPLSKQTINVSGFGHYGTTDGATGTLLDIDSDGVRDRVSVGEESKVCTLTWQKGLFGGQFEFAKRKTALPTALWFEEWKAKSEPKLITGERCTLNGQVAFRERGFRVPSGPGAGQIITKRVKGIVSYHFLDYTGDGRVDLLTNIWANTAHDSYIPAAPVAAEIPLGGSDKGMSPEGTNDNFVWRVYRNVADPEPVLPPAEPGSVFLKKPMKIISPLPLPPSAGEDKVDTSVLPSFSIPPLIDIDGDGFLDVVDITRDNNILGKGDWRVYLGNGGPKFPGKFEALTWKVPRFNMAIQGNGFAIVPDRSCGLTIERVKSTIASLRDIDGNGLLDLLVQTDDNRLKAFRNTGSDFQSTPIDLHHAQSLERLQTDCVTPSLVQIKDGNRGHRERFIDLDGDGLPDNIQMSGGSLITNASDVFVKFNMGDRFGPLVRLPPVWLDARRLLAADGGNWQLDTDFVDVTGDGLADLVRWNSNNTLTFINRPGLPSAPDLLRSVKNGRGQEVKFTYAPTTDPDTVKWKTLTKGGPYLPTVQWVVDTVTIDAGFDTPAMVTRYTYKDPRYHSPSEYTGIPERSHFAGFEETTQTSLDTDGVPLKRITRAYAYGGTGAPDGRLVSERIFRAEAGAFRLHSFEEIAWKRKPLFSGEVLFTHREHSLLRTCKPGTSETECMTQTDHVRRIQEIWEPRDPISGVDPSDPSLQPKLYVRSIAQQGTGVAEDLGERRTTSRFQLRYGQSPFRKDDYRVLVTQVLDEEGVKVTFTDGPAGLTKEVLYERIGQTEVHFDQATGLPIQTDQFLDDNTVASTKRTYDPQTGNQLSETKPVQGAPGGSGKSQTNEHDGHKLFIKITTNELGHKVETDFDLATGALVKRKGPNFKTLASGDVVLEQETWTVDGFGRVVGHAISIDHETAGYKLLSVETNMYFDFETPTRVRNEKARDFSGSVSVTTDRTVDGRGRLLSEVLHLDGGLNAVTSYKYDEMGNVVGIHVPDPRTDGQHVQYEYHFDPLGRLTNFIRPDGNGIAIAYAGLEKTLRETTNDGSGSSKKQVYDVLGRLIEVHEFDPTATTAITRYSYRADNTLVKVVDAEGNETILTHDLLGNRTAITRGSRNWDYMYNLNSELIERINPHSEGANLAQFTTGYAHDDLDRVTTVSFVDTQGMNIHRLFYDTGTNAIGRLNKVELSFGEIHYDYNARGLLISEQRTIKHDGIDLATQMVQRQYNALALPTLSTWDDGQQWRITYDERGLVDTVEWRDPQTDTFKQVADYTRALGGQPRQRTSSFSQARQFTYDVLGRPTLDIVTRPGHPEGPAISSRAYVYSDSGDLTSVSGDTNGVSATASYSYDAWHRLRTATGPNEYQGGFTYSPTGNILTAKVAWNDSPQTRNVRYEYGQTDPQAVDRLINVAGDTHAEFAYDLSGNMIERTTPKGQWQLDWNGLDQIRSVQSPDGSETYHYDHTGTRILAVSEGGDTRFWFAESETHFDQAGTQLRRYLHLAGSGPTLARVENAIKVELQYADALQNLMLSLDTEGSVAASFLHGPFGEILDGIGADDHRRQFNGKENDVVTGLRYYGFRYYDPLILRWNQADPLYRFLPDRAQTEPQRTNLYAFSLNNPIRHYDPDGREPLEITKQFLETAGEWVAPAKDYQSVIGLTEAATRAVLAAPVIVVGTVVTLNVDAFLESREGEFIRDQFVGTEEEEAPSADCDLGCQVNVQIGFEEYLRNREKLAHYSIAGKESRIIQEDPKPKPKPKPKLKRKRERAIEKDTKRKTPNRTPAVPPEGIDLFGALYRTWWPERR